MIFGKELSSNLLNRLTEHNLFLDEVYRLLSAWFDQLIIEYQDKAIGIVEKYIKTNKGRFTSSVFPPQSAFISYTKSTSSEITHTDFES